jgi:hypothetical protein
MADKRFYKECGGSSMSQHGRQASTRNVEGTYVSMSTEEYLRCRRQQYMSMAGRKINLRCRRQVYVNMAG